MSEISLLSLSDLDRRLLAATLWRCLNGLPHPPVGVIRRAALEELQQRLMEGLEPLDEETE